MDKEDKYLPMKNVVVPIEIDDRYKEIERIARTMCRCDEEKDINDIIAINRERTTKEKKYAQDLLPIGIFISGRIINTVNIGKFIIMCIGFLIKCGYIGVIMR